MKATILSQILRLLIFICFVCININSVRANEPEESPSSETTSSSADNDSITESQSENSQYNQTSDHTLHHVGIGPHFNFREYASKRAKLTGGGAKISIGSVGLQSLHFKSDNEKKVKGQKLLVWDGDLQMGVSGNNISSAVSNQKNARFIQFRGNGRLGLIYSCSYIVCPFAGAYADAEIQVEENSTADGTNISNVGKVKLTSSMLRFSAGVTPTTGLLFRAKNVFSLGVSADLPIQYFYYYYPTEAEKSYGNNIPDIDQQADKNSTKGLDFSIGSSLYALIYDQFAITGQFAKSLEQRNIDRTEGKGGFLIVFYPKNGSQHALKATVGGGRLVGTSASDISNLGYLDVFGGYAVSW